MTGPPPEPTALQLAGPGLLPAIRRYGLATRPQFLTASFLPVLVGTAWGVRAAGPWDGWSFLLAAVAVLLLHAASNVLNDVGDEWSGSDRNNHERIYPFTGGSRFIQNGILDARAMLRFSLGLFAAAVLFGAVLLWKQGWPVLMLGLAGLALGSLYSLPRVALAGLGIGELAIGLAFGVLPVLGAAWLQGLPADATALLLSLPVAAWVTAILLINEVPDRAADAAAGKRTLPVRWGLRATVWLYGGLQASAFLFLVAWQQVANLPFWVLLVPSALSLAGWRAARAIDGSREQLAEAIRLTLLVHASGCLWLAACSLWA